MKTLELTQEAIALIDLAVCDALNRAADELQQAQREGFPRPVIQQAGIEHATLQRLQPAIRAALTIHLTLPDDYQG